MNDLIEEEEEEDWFRSNCCLQFRRDMNTVCGEQQQKNICLPKKAFPNLSGEHNSKLASPSLVLLLSSVTYDPAIFVINKAEKG